MEFFVKLCEASVIVMNACSNVISDFFGWPRDVFNSDFASYTVYEWIALACFFFLFYVFAIFIYFAVLQSFQMKLENACNPLIERIFSFFSFRSGRHSQASLNIPEGTLLVTSRGDPVFRVLSSAEVISLHLDLINRLRDAANLREDVWESYGITMVYSLARLCGPLPASEFNHDHDECGLFRHSIKVAIEALSPYSKDFNSYKLRRFDKQNECYLRYQNDCAGLALMLAAFTHDLSKLSTDFEVVADNGALYDPYKADLEHFVKNQQASTLTVKFKAHRAKAHDQCIAASSVLLLKSIPSLAAALIKGFDDCGTQADLEFMLRHELAEKKRADHGSPFYVNAEEKGDDDDEALTESDDGVVIEDHTAAKNSKSQSLEERIRAQRLEKNRTQQQELIHFYTPNHWTLKQVSSLLDGTHPLWEIVRKADSFCAYDERYTASWRKTGNAFLSSFVICRIKEQTHLVNSIFADLFLVSDGVLLRRGSPVLRELSEEITARTRGDYTNFIQALEAIGAVVMVGTRRVYSWKLIECDERTFFMEGIIIKVRLPEFLVRGFKSITCLERGAAPQELKDLLKKHEDITCFDYDEDFRLVPRTGYGVEADVFKKLYGVTPAQYRTLLGFNDTVDAWIEEEYAGSKNGDRPELRQAVSE